MVCGLKITLCAGIFTLLMSVILGQYPEPEEGRPDDLPQQGPYTTVFRYVDPEGTTPGECPHATRCGFQLYDSDTRLTKKFKFVKYCDCPEGMTCEKDGDDMNMAFYYYMCKNATVEPTTEAMAREGKELFGVEGDIEESRDYSDRVGSLAPRNEL